MTRRLVAVLPPAVAGPEGFPPEPLWRAMAEDLYETVAGLELVEPVLAVGPDAPADVATMVWPGTEVVQLTEGSAPEALARLGELGADEATVLSGDAPDLPALLVGKLHRGLGSAEVAALPAAGGGLVALASRCPTPAWLVGSAVGFDSMDALDRLRAAAPRRGLLFVGPGWHRLRAPADLARLDDGLEGWELTRSVLASRPGSTSPGEP